MGEVVEVIYVGDEGDVGNLGDIKVIREMLFHFQKIQSNHITIFRDALVKPKVQIKSLNCLLL